MSISESEIKQAEARMRARLSAMPSAVGVRYDRRVSRIVVSLNTGLEVAFPPHLAQGLEHAKPDDLIDIEITPSGLGLHFPKVDADLYLPALLEGVFGSRQWMARQLGRSGGAAKTPAKALAARENGKLGGRPRKAVVV